MEGIEDGIPEDGTTDTDSTADGSHRRLPVSLHPLSVDEALSGAMHAVPLKDDNPKPKKSPKKPRKKRKK